MSLDFSGVFLSDNPKVLWGVLSFAALQAIAAIIVERNYQRRPILIGFMAALAALTASLITFEFMLHPSEHSAQEMLIIFVIGLILWMLVFHIGAIHGGSHVKPWFTRRFRRDALICIIGSNWVKAIDYVYLTLSSFSILRIVVSAVTTAQGSMHFNAFAAILLGFAVALRITRTSIEVFELDKPPADRTWATP